LLDSPVKHDTTILFYCNPRGIDVVRAGWMVIRLSGDLLFLVGPLGYSRALTTANQSA